jgi:hypothetical protein
MHGNQRNRLPVAGPRVRGGAGVVKGGGLCTVVGVVVGARVRVGDAAEGGDLAVGRRLGALGKRRRALGRVARQQQPSVLVQRDAHERVPGTRPRRA